jgi:hypothetical protein
MAGKSGGQAFHRKAGIRGAIAQAVAEGENYYTLSYSPAKRKFDGKVRTIRVAINRKEYRVRFRQHYFADDPSRDRAVSRHRFARDEVSNDALAGRARIWFG